MKSLIISGGGSKGAFAGGIAQHLIIDQKKDYDLYVGTSTGSLLTPFIALGELDRLKEAYTSVSQDDIFTVNPFKIKKDKNGSVKIGMDYMNVLYNVLIRKQKSFGDSTALRDSIDHFMSERDFNILKNSGKEVIACVTNLTLADVEYKSTLEYGFKDYGDWMSASASVPPFMSIIRKDGFEYADGGIIDHVPIQIAIDKGATEIDILILRKENQNMAPEVIRNPFHYIFRVVDMMINEISYSDVSIAKLSSTLKKDVHLNFYYTPRKLTNNSLIFNKKVMGDWWKEGYEFAKKQECKRFKLSRSGKMSELMS